jgi:hypothetical protein
MSEREITVDRTKMVGGRNVIGRRWIILSGDGRREQEHEKMGKKKKGRETAPSQSFKNRDS